MAFTARHGPEGELLGHLGRDISAARGDLTDGLLQLGGRAFLGEIAAGAGLDGAHCVLQLLVHAEHQDAQLGIFRAHQLDQLHAAAPRHRQVQHEQVELEFAHALHDFAAVGGFADHLHVLDIGDDALESLAHDGVVVGDHDPDHEAAPFSLTGMRTCTRVPCPTRFRC